MRDRNLLFAACVALLAIAGALWFANSDPGARSGDSATEAHSESDASTASETPAELEASAKAPNETARPVVEAARVAYSADNPLARGAIVLGALSARDGSPVLARSVHLDFWREKTLVAALDNETMGVYRAGPLEPGKYRVAVSSERFDAQEFELTVPDDATTLVRDLVLTEPLVLVVRAQTPAGDPLASALMRMPEFDYSYFLDVVPTTEPVELDSQISNRGVHVSEVSAGKFIRDLRALDGSDVVGTLRVRALPVFVHLTWARTVLTSVRADENMHEVRLAVDPRKLAERFGTLRVQVVDADSRLAVEGANVAVQQRQTNRTTSGVTDVYGVCVLRGVSPENVELEITSSEYCPWSQKLDVAAASVTDAGLVSLARLVTLDVRVVDRDGKPVQQNLEVIELTELSQENRPMQLTTIPVEVEFDVVRVPNLQRKRYVVRSRGAMLARFVGASSGGRSALVQLQDGSSGYVGENPFAHALRVAPTLVDLETLERRELVLTAAPASACTLELGFDADPYLKLRIATSEGLTIGETQTAGNATLALALLPGDYKVKLTSRERPTVERTFSVRTGPNVIHVP